MHSQHTYLGEEEVMSDVHLGCPPGFSGAHFSKFLLFVPKCIERRRFDFVVKEHEVSMQPSVLVDDDGDLILKRRCYETVRDFSLIIHHNTKSSIPDVGLQVWRGELALSDFLLHKVFNSSDLDGIVALELGAGTGIAGILLACVAKTVYLTDYNDAVLDNSERNLYLNRGLLKHQDSVLVRKLDWMKSWPPLTDESSRYTWSVSDVKEMEDASLILAADVLYDDRLTDAFFKILEGIMSHGCEKVLYLSLEKRYNFSLDDLDIIANGYTHFRRYIQSNEESSNLDDESQPRFVGKCLDLSLIPQYVKNYDRGRDMELWEIKYHRRCKDC